MTRKEDKQDPMHQAVSYLARREHSRYELKQKLLSKEHTEDLVESVLNDLQNRSYLDDQRYAEVMIRHHYLRGQGPQKIRFMLGQKGVSKSIIERAFAEFDQDWYTLASDVRQKRFGCQFKSNDKSEQFTEKSLFLPVTVKNAPDSLKIFPNKVKTNFVIGLSQYDAISEKDFQLEVDLNGIPINQANNTAPISLIKQPAEVKNIRFSPKSVQFLFVKE